MLYTLFVGGAMGSFAELYSQLQRTLGATQRVRELLRETTAEPLPTGPCTGRPVPGCAARWSSSTSPSAIRRGRKCEVLHDVSLTARPGQRIALVGPSGAGKSTLVSLLLRFYEPEAGRILIDGRDARDYPLHDLRGQMAIVPQDVLLFGGTDRRTTSPTAGPARARRRSSRRARKANAHDFIARFPEGYQTRVGERGVQLSGGQRQRVAIARAILRDPAILILDEATSSLDSESESLVLQALDRLMQGRTSLVIAHRLSTVRKADRIYVIKEGATVEEGTHAELLTRANGVYRLLSELQFETNGVGQPAATV